ncbi:MAG: MurR/RpiR family transcriptional regulator [Clostridia bacterium]|nr:MurR/RpiR family transcriptional regulator [Clostridia bacterium]
MSTDLITHILQEMPGFSKGQRRIASYIVEHYDEAAFMTAFRLGETVGVSESTVVRFATELGFAGYPQLQKAIQKLIRSKLTSVQRVEVSRSRMRDDQVLEQVMTYDMANIRQTLEEMPRDVFDEAVRALVGARHVYVFGAGSCRALAQFCAFYLKLLLPDVRLINTAGETEILEELYPITSDDALLVVSFPRYSSRSVKAAHFAHSRQAKVIAVTDSMLSPVAELSSSLLLAHSDMPTVVDSLAAPLSVINALLVAISLKRADDNRARLNELEALWETYQIYQPLGKQQSAEEQP